VDLHPYGLCGSCSHTVDEWGKATVTSSAQFASANYASVILGLIRATVAGTANPELPITAALSDPVLVGPLREPTSNCRT
jgi:hypothetical protein